MTTMKLNGHFSSCTACIQKPIHVEGNAEKHHIYVTKLKMKGEAQNDRWKISASYNAINGVAQSSVNHLQPEISSVRIGESGYRSEDLTFHKQLAPSEYQEYHSVNLFDKLKAVHLHLLASEHWNASRLKLCHRIYLQSATNLTHYLALQCLDVEKLKEDLSSIGLLNMEFINSCILASTNLGIKLLQNLVSKNHLSKRSSYKMHDLDYIIARENKNLSESTIFTMKNLVSSHEAALFGPHQEDKISRIMVTVGREAISNEALVPDLLKEGTNVIRINCAHDDSKVWDAIIRITKHSSQTLKKPCRILMDLAGPKLRTGLVMKDANVVKISPQMDDKGDVTSPALIFLCSAGSSPPSHLILSAVLCVEQEFLDGLKLDDVLSFVDVRGRKRSLKICENSHLVTCSSSVGDSPSAANSGYIAECSQTAYIGFGTKLFLKKKDRKISVGRVVKIPSVDQYITLNTGDLLTISRKSFSTTIEGLNRSVLGSARITCSSDCLFDAVKLGEPIAFDDGKIWGEVKDKNANEIIVLVTHASPLGSRLGAGKSINIPKSEVQLKGLTSKDLIDLDFVVAHADMVGLSFLRDVDDMILVQRELEKRKVDKLGVVLKIETRQAFQNLPLLIFQAMKFSNPLGVMIARGDLMVECGWDQMAYIQDEIMAICNAAHIPVIWATQVLESLIKFGFPTRAEITDMATGTNVSCIMLNKGEHIIEAVSALDSILHNRAIRKKKKKMMLKLPLPSRGPSQ
ncbi:plastidial pyruvate kinase 4, chloroplastic-like [Typha latifolia]|uniref:plastidial pyruvate kinase 4, chloroplastic-like n=1 Tax=Typha latifolia TaxID=4733 RepID=UPI003C2B2142